MTASEFSNQFDVLYNNITSNQAPGLNEYEKSVFLTKAQNELVLNYFSPKSKGNNIQEGFDNSPIRQADFSTLIKTEHLKNPSTDDSNAADPRAKVYTSAQKIYIIINEMLVDADDSKRTRTVVPISYQEYMRLMSKPFKEPLKWQAWRLLNEGTNDSFRAEIITTSVDKDEKWIYFIRYVKKPHPIILANIGDAYGEGLTIDGVSNTDSTAVCELPEIMHEQILQRAVELAKIAWGGDGNQTQLEIQSGQRSE